MGDFPAWSKHPLLSPLVATSPRCHIQLVNCYGSSQHFPRICLRSSPTSFLPHEGPPSSLAPTILCGGPGRWCHLGPNVLKHTLHVQRCLQNTSALFDDPVSPQVAGRGRRLAHMEVPGVQRVNRLPRQAPVPPPFNSVFDLEAFIQASHHRRIDGVGAYEDLVLNSLRLFFRRCPLRGCVPLTLCTSTHGMLVGDTTSWNGGYNLFFAGRCDLKKNPGCYTWCPSVLHTQITKASERGEGQTELEVCGLFCWCMSFD